MRGYYHVQLVAGYHVTRPDYGLVACMPISTTW